MSPFHCTFVHPDARNHGDGVPVIEGICLKYEIIPAPLGRPKYYTTIYLIAYEGRIYEIEGSENVNFKSFLAVEVSEDVGELTYK